MKKTGIAIAIAGSVITIIGLRFRFMENRAVTIIGGADGPTSIFLAGKVGNGIGIIEIIIGIVILIIGFVIILLKK